jgi:hypothetical protein
MGEEAIQLFLAALGDLQRRIQGDEGDDEAIEFMSEDADQMRRAAWFREDLLAVLGDPRLAETWDPERLSGEEVFTTYVHVASAYLHGAEEDRRPYLRGVMTSVRDLSEDPEYVRHVLPLLAISPGDRWALLVHGAIHAKMIDENDAAWPVPRAEIDAVATRLTHPDAQPGANFHVKHLRELGLVNVAKKPRLYSQLEHTPNDLWLFVSLKDEAQRFVATLGFR